MYHINQYLSDSQNQYMGLCLIVPYSPISYSKPALIFISAFTMTRPPSNSLIITKLDPTLLENPTAIADLLAPRKFNVELVFLPKFARYIIISVSPLVAAQIRDFLVQKLGSKAHVSYSIRDNRLEILDDDLWLLKTEKGHSTAFLELPLEDGSRRFLILPPLSPHAEWDDYNKEEDGPNQKAVYSPQELSHLLWDRFGGFDSSKVRRFDIDSDNSEEGNTSEDDQKDYVDISTQPQVLFEDIHNGVPAIVVDSVKNQKKGQNPPLPKTYMPPV